MSPWGPHKHTRACYRYQRETEMLAIAWLHRHTNGCKDCHGTDYMPRMLYVPEAGNLICQCIEAGQCSACGEFSRPENDLTTPCTRCGFFPAMSVTDPDPLETRPLCICGALERETQAMEEATNG
jgi:hypothetical protein